MHPSAGNSSYPNVSPMTTSRHQKEHCPRGEQCGSNELDNFRHALVSLKSTLEFDGNDVNSNSGYEAKGETNKNEFCLKMCWSCKDQVIVVI